MILVVAGTVIAGAIGVIWNMFNQRMNSVKNDIDQVRNELESTRIQTIESIREIRQNVAAQLSDLGQYTRHEVRNINNALLNILKQRTDDED